MSILDQIRACVTRFQVDQNKIPSELHIGRTKLYDLSAELRSRHTKDHVLSDVLTLTERRQIYGPDPISIFGMKVILCTDDPNHLSVRSSTHTPQPQQIPEGYKLVPVEPPANCRQRLAREGKPYPRSSCAVCGKLSPKFKECDAMLEAAPEPKEQ